MTQGPEVRLGHRLGPRRWCLLHPGQGDTFPVFEMAEVLPGLGFSQTRWLQCGWLSDPRVWVAAGDLLGGHGGLL